MKLLIIAALTSVSTVALAHPEVPTRTSPGVVTSADKIPTDVRRTTLIVHNIDNSLMLYRDILGLKVNYDAIVKMGGVALPAGKPGDEARLVLVNGNDSWIGWIGFLQWINPALDPVPTYSKHLTYGGTVIVMNTDDVEGRCAAAAKVPGVTVTATPHTTFYPGRNNGPKIEVKGCNFFDPDGYLVELNQIQQ